MSSLDFLKPIFRYIPEVEAPSQKPNISQRLTWTFLVVVVFVLLGLIQLYGLSATATQNLSTLQVLLASSIGTILTVGIGPIVVASIILQLLVGAGLIKLDFSNQDDRRSFSSLQKLLTVVIAFFEATIFTVLGVLQPEPGMAFLIILQVALGSIILMYLDEIVQKYGIGSGISLFIAVGVATEILWRIFNPISALAQGFQLVSSGATFSFSSGSGLLWSFFSTASSNFYNAFVMNLIPIISALIVFAVVVYFIGIYINIPITLGRPGQFGRFPVKFMYVSNMPVILSVALFANIALFSGLLARTTIPYLPSIFAFIAKYTTAPSGILEQLLLQGFSVALFPELLHALVYTIILMVLCVLFGIVWVQIANQDSDSVAKQLDNSGMYLPGFRRDPRVIKGVLDKYIPTITILSAAFVGFLAGFASLAGAVGTGTGILLTVDIVYRFYEELAKEQLSDSAFLGKVLSSMKK